MKVGDWVFFKTRNRPKDVRVVKTDSDTGETTDITGEGHYRGQGRIIGMAANNYTVREEKTNRVVEVGPHPDDEIHSLAYDYNTLTLGQLRAFLEQYQDAPDDILVAIALPLSFFSDEGDLPPDHPEYRAVSACQVVDACGICFMALSEDGESTDRYVPPGERHGEDWEFYIEITPHPEQSFEALREQEGE